MTLTHDEQIAEALEQLKVLAVTTFRERGETFERDGVLPMENLRDIHRLGLLNATPSRQAGGLSGNLLGERPDYFSKFFASFAVAIRPRGIAINCTPRRVEPRGRRNTGADRALLKPALASGSLLACRCERAGNSTMYTLNTFCRKSRRRAGSSIGVKHFVTNGQAAALTIVRVATVRGGDPSTQQLLIVEHDREGVSWDDDWYRPNGMRAARSRSCGSTTFSYPTATRWGRSVHMPAAAGRAATISAFLLTTLERPRPVSLVC